MSVELNTFDGEELTPKNYAIPQENALSNGVLYGCELTFLGSNQIKISSGFIMVKGRLVIVLEETVLCELASSGTEKGRLYLKVDLADATTPAELLTVSATTLPALTQDDDFNTANGIWEMELGIYDTSTTAISNLETTYANVVDVGDSDISSIGDGSLTGAILSIYNNIDAGGTVLWENPNSNPATVSFAGQTVTLSETIANFDYYEVEHSTASNLPNIRRTTGKIPTENDALMILGLGDGYRRAIAPSGTGLEFEDGSYDSATNNGVAIPTRIIGYTSK